MPAGACWQDDDIPYETLTTFCRLSRMSLLQRKLNMEVRRRALIIVDCQNDFSATGTVPVTVCVCVCMCVCVCVCVCVFVCV